MKNRILLIAFWLMVINSLQTQGQAIITRNDSILLGQDSVVKLVIPPVRGNIQWQKSFDSENWIDMAGETNDTLTISAGAEALYRAIVSENYCQPVISDSAGIIVPGDTITKNFVDASSVGLNLVSDSLALAGGKYMYTGTGAASALEVGKVLVDEQSGGTIRIITDLSQADDTVSVQTEQATMEDLFLDDSFNLSTEMIYPEGDLKNASLEELGKLLTDEEGFIHPIEVIDVSPEGKFLKSASVFSKAKNPQSSLYLHVDWSNFPLFEYSDSDTSGNSSIEYTIKAYISEGYFTFDPEIKLEFSYQKPKVSLWPPRVSKGQLQKFKFYLDNATTDIKNVVVLESNFKYEYELEKILKKNAVKKIFKFAIGPVPVWIQVDVDIKSKLNFTVDGESVLTQGFQNVNHITLGAAYENGQWEPLHNFDTETNLYLSNEGFVHSGIRFDIFPDIDIKLYSLVGPEMQVGPYMQFDIYHSFADNWNKSLDLGIDSKVGASVTILGKQLASLPEKTSNLYEKNLWSSPNNTTVYGNKQSAKIGERLPNSIIVKVNDSREEPVANVWVNFKPKQGSVSAKKVKTDDYGLARTIWVLSEEPGQDTMKILVYDGQDEEIKACTKAVYATAILPALPIISTNEIIEITDSSAISGGNITDQGDSPVTARGICWSNSGNPTIADSKTNDGTGTGSFTSELSGLIKCKTYYVRAYATNSTGTSYGTERSFSTNSSIPAFTTWTDNRDNHTYKTVIINGQEWLAENYAYLPKVNFTNDGSLTSPQYTVYGYSGTSISKAKETDAYKTYGALYNWTAALESCPEGWHIPSDEEWTALENYLIENGNNYDATYMENKIGKSMAVDTLWESSTNVGAVGNSDYPCYRNLSGFSGLPGGHRLDTDGTFWGMGIRGFWWSATEGENVFTPKPFAWQRGLLHDSKTLYRSLEYKSFGLSVRLVRDLGN